MLNKKIVKIISAVLSAVMVLSFSLIVPASTTAVAAPYTDATIQKLQASIDKINSQVKENKKALDKIKAEQKDIDEQADLVEEGIALTQEKIKVIEALLSELNTRILDMNLAIGEKSADIDEQYERFKNRVRVAYEEGNVSYLEMIFGAKDIGDFLSRLEYVNAMVEYDNQLMKDYQNDKKLLEEEKLKLEQAMQLQEESKSTLDIELMDLDSQQRELEDIRAQLREKYNEQWQEYKKAQEKEEELSKELEEYIRKLQEANNKLYVGGEFIWPLDHKYSRISSPFGWRYLWGNLDNHQAIDIPCDLNAPVYASNGGTIIKAEHHSSYGNYVIIDHGGGRSTLYAHNNKLQVKEGDEVYQGQVIALAGTTGSSTGVHVHFEYRVNGVRQNPLNVVSQP